MTPLKNAGSRKEAFLHDVAEMVRSSGIDVVPREILARMAQTHRLSRADACMFFIGAAWDFHVEEWPLGLSSEQYRREHAKRVGVVNIWAAVIQALPVPRPDPSTPEANTKDDGPQADVPFGVPPGAPPPAPPTTEQEDFATGGGLA